MYKIEITAETLAELTGKVTTLAAKLHTGSATEGPTQLRITATGDLVREVAEKPKAKKATKKVEAEVAEEAPVDPTPSSPPATETNTTQSSEQAPKSAAAAEATESQPTTPEQSSTAAPAPSASEPTLDFEKDVAPVVIEAVARVGREGVSSTLAEFGAERASEVDPSQYGELVKALEAL